MLETVSAFSILMLAALVILPLMAEVRSSQHDLSIERKIAYSLHEEFFTHVESTNSYPFSKSIFLPVPVHMLFKENEHWIKGCATWENHRGKTKEYCLYAPSE